MNGVNEMKNLSVLVFLLSLIATTAKAAELNVDSFGATPNDNTDDTAALQAALNALQPEDTLTFSPGGEYLHNRELILDNAMNVEIDGRGAILTATVQNRAALQIEDSVNVTVTSLDFNANATSRSTSDRSCAVLLYRTSEVQIISNRMHGFAGCAVMVQTSNSFLVMSNVVEDTFADGIHVTNGSFFGLIAYNMAFDTGDDCFAVVSYKEKNPTPVDTVIISGNSCEKTPHPPVAGQPAYHGRGLAIDGGNNITFENNYVLGAASACAIVASSSVYNAWPVNNVIIRLNTFEACNQDSSVYHGAVLLTARAAGPVTGVMIQDNSIIETVGANSHIRVSNYSTQVVVDDNMVLDADSSHTFMTAYAGSQVTSTNNVYCTAPGTCNPVP